MGKCMIGPFPGRQTCPECDGEGIYCAGQATDYQPGWGTRAIEHGEYKSFNLYVQCDICGGNGTVTKATVEWYEESYGQVAA